MKRLFPKRQPRDESKENLISHRKQRDINHISSVGIRTELNSEDGVNPAKLVIVFSDGIDPQQKTAPVFVRERSHPNGGEAASGCPDRGP